MLAITGVTGFIGPHVITEALKHDVKVRAMVRDRRRAPAIDHPRLEWFEASLGMRDAEFVRGADSVLHMAGLIKARRLQDYLDINADAAETLAQASVKARVPRFVLLSSMAAREPQLSHYAASKRAGEDQIRQVLQAQYKGQHIGQLAIIRAPAVFGPGDVATQPFMKAIQKGVLPVPGGAGWRDRRLSLVYVKDLARDLVRAALGGHYDDQIVSPATITDTNWSTFAGLCAQAAEHPVRPMALPIALLYPLAALTSVTSRLMGVGHLTLGKLREFMHSDWSTQTLILEATSPIEAIKETLKSYTR